MQQSEKTRNEWNNSTAWILFSILGLALLLPAIWGGWLNRSTVVSGRLVVTCAQLPDDDSALISWYERNGAANVNAKRIGIDQITLAYECPSNSTEPMAPPLPELGYIGKIQSEETVTSKTEFFGGAISAN